MSPEQIQGLKQLFHMIDADDSGTITVQVPSHLLPHGQPRKRR